MASTAAEQPPPHGERFPEGPSKPVWEQASVVLPTDDPRVPGADSIVRMRVIEWGTVGCDAGCQVRHSWHPQVTSSVQCVRVCCAVCGVVCRRACVRLGRWSASVDHVFAWQTDGEFMDAREINAATEQNKRSTLFKAWGAAELEQQLRETG